MTAEQDAPVIVIAASTDCRDIWQDVLLGLEEEGIPWRWQPTTQSDITVAAWQAASQSRLLVGIACDAQQLIVHYRNLPVSAPLFTLMRHQDHHAMRCTGNNAARLVKGLPFRTSEI